MPFVKLTTALNLPRLGGNGKERHTDTNELLSPGVLIAYQGRTGYPTQAIKNRVNAAAVQARNIVRIANDEMAKVVIMRKKEPDYFKEAMERHFNLRSDGDKAGGLLTDNTIDKPFSLGATFKHDRRWVLEQIRQGMLSLSFHLNTGVYIIDLDAGTRDIAGGRTGGSGRDFTANTEAYVFQWAGDGASLCGFRNGEIHLEFEKMPNYNVTSAARIIIHEAAHKFLNVKDTFYAHDANYPPSLEKCLNANADSYAWTAVSLATGDARMMAGQISDWFNCPPDATL